MLTDAGNTHNPADGTWPRRVREVRRLRHSMQGGGLRAIISIILLNRGRDGTARDV